LLFLIDDYVSFNPSLTQFVTQSSFDDIACNS